MTSNNTFSFHRLALLLKQNFLHQYKLFGIYIAAFAGGVFILLFVIHMADEFREKPIHEFVEIFVSILIVVSVLSTGTAFPNLRRKEKALAYLLLPASTLEKMTAEILIRIVLLVILVPALYWLVFGLENSIVSALNPDYRLIGDIEFSIPNGPSDENGQMIWWYILFISMICSIFILPFTGSTVFVKNPLVKTLFSLAVIVMFNVFLVYFFVEVLNFREFYPRKQVLFINDARSAITTAAIISVIFNVALLSASYFKLKEREV